MPVYKCNGCGRVVGRDNLVVKRVAFHEMGRGGKLIRHRVESWLCKDRCLLEDDVWQKPKYERQMKEAKKQ